MPQATQMPLVKLFEPGSEGPNVDLSLPQLSFKSQERILPERFQFIVPGRWGVGLWGFSGYLKK